MKQEQWEYIVSNWASADPVVQEEIAKIKDADTLAMTEMENKIKDRDKKIQELNQQNIDLNKTNMSLFLRLTDPKLAKESDDLDDDKPIPKIDDYDSFIINS